MSFLPEREVNEQADEGSELLCSDAGLQGPPGCGPAGPGVMAPCHLLMSSLGEVALIRRSLRAQTPDPVSSPEANSASALVIMAA